MENGYRSGGGNAAKNPINDGGNAAKNPIDDGGNAAKSPIDDGGNAAKTPINGSNSSPNTRFVVCVNHGDGGGVTAAATQMAKSPKKPTTEMPHPLSSDVETAFEIYHETYGIHELPPME